MNAVDEIKNMLRGGSGEEMKKKKKLKQFCLWTRERPTITGANTSATDTFATLGSHNKRNHLYSLTENNNNK